MPHQSVDQQQAVTVVVSERLSALSTKKFEEIASLPKVSSEHLVIDGKKTTVSVWHDALPSGEHLVAVQAYKPWILGIGRMYVDGFAINSRNQRRPLTQDEWAPFS